MTHEANIKALNLLHICSYPADNLLEVRYGIETQMIERGVREKMHVCLTPVYPEIVAVVDPLVRIVALVASGDGEEFL